MSAALINRSLTTIRTELEFLRDSDVITEQLYEKLNLSLPSKYQKDMAPWDANHLTNDNKANDSTPQPTPQKTPVAELSEKLSQTAIVPPAAPPKLGPSPVGYCKALFDYTSQEPGDLALAKDDKIAVTEHLSEDWWKGYKAADGPSKTGVFPSNYVNVISQQEFEVRQPVPPPEKATYSPVPINNPPPQYSPNQQMQQPMQQQPSYGGYSQYPPPSTNYYPQQEQVQQPAQALSQHPHLRKFGGKLGNAAIFGAGATIGSDIVNSIF